MRPGAPAAAPSLVSALGALGQSPQMRRTPGAAGRWVLGAGSPPPCSHEMLRGTWSLLPASGGVPLTAPPFPPAPTWPCSCGCAGAAGPAARARAHRLCAARPRTGALAQQQLHQRHLGPHQPRASPRPRPRHGAAGGRQGPRTRAVSPEPGLGEQSQRGRLPCLPSPAQEAPPRTQAMYAGGASLQQPHIANSPVAR
jgi:hypothetical protein